MLKIPKQYEMERVVSDDPHRLSILGIRYEAEKQRLVATNGKALVIVPVEREEGSSEDNTGSIPVEAFKAARKTAVKYGTNAGCAPMTLNGKIELADGRAFPYQHADASFPDVDCVVPKPAANALRLSLNPAMLYDLARAMGSGEAIELILPAPEGPASLPEIKGGILVKTFTKGEKEAYGVFMPLQPKR